MLSVIFTVFLKNNYNDDKKKNNYNNPKTNICSKKLLLRNKIPTWYVLNVRRVIKEQNLLVKSAGPSTHMK